VSSGGTGTVVEAVLPVGVTAEPVSPEPWSAKGEEQADV
jgi:hypothetical protein